MDSSTIKQVDISVFDLDDEVMAQKLVRVHGRIMTIEGLRDALIPKHRKVRQEAVSMKHLYAAIQAGDKAKSKHIFNRLQGTVGLAEIHERLSFHMLLESFVALVGEV